MPLSGIWIKYSVMFDVEKVRRDFPILGVRVYDKPLVYLDSGATAQKPECVIETVDRLHRESNANIHRGVHFLSEEATEMYEAARLVSPSTSVRKPGRRSFSRPELLRRSIRWRMHGANVFSGRATISWSARWSTIPISFPGSLSPSARVPKSACCLSTRRGA